MACSQSLLSFKLMQHWSLQTHHFSASVPVYEAMSLVGELITLAGRLPRQNFPSGMVHLGLFFFSILSGKSFHGFHSPSSPLQAGSMFLCSWVCLQHPCGCLPMEVSQSPYPTRLVLLGSWISTGIPSPSSGLSHHFLLLLLLLVYSPPWERVPLQRDGFNIWEEAGDQSPFYLLIYTCVCMYINILMKYYLKYIYVKICLWVYIYMWHIYHIHMHSLILAWKKFKYSSDKDVY